jgi:hypothetical protein
MKHMGWMIILLVGCAVLAGGVWLGAREHRWLRQSAVTAGTVVELITSRSSKGGDTYAPRVSFKGADGVAHEFTRSYFSSPADFQVGESVLVAYDRETCEGLICSFGQRFGTATVIACVGLCMTLMAGMFLYGPGWFQRQYLGLGTGMPPVTQPNHLERPSPTRSR